MSLFPAYSPNVLTENKDDEQVRWESDPPSETNDVMEAELLASDVEEETVSRRVETIPASNDDFYVDCKMDCGNLRVSTLYYPGRPQYESSTRRLDEGRQSGKERKARRRYFRKRVPDDPDTAAVAERASAYRRLLDDSPHDVSLWERYIDFMERCASEKEAVEAVELAVAKAGGSRELRTRMYAALRRTLPSQPYAERLRNSLAKERDMNIRLELWLELMRAVGSAAEGGVQAVTSVVGAALNDTRNMHSAYADLLYEYGVYIRSGGLWEQLVQLIELVAAMNFPRGPFPPPRDHELERRAELRLRDIEDKAIDSGLPLSAVWVRVEKARGAAHWRPCVSGGVAGSVVDDGGDPQRTPLPHDVAELLLPVVDPHQLFRLSVRLLMLAKVPLVCGNGWSGRGSLGCRWECVEELLPLLSEARTMHEQHAAHAKPAHAQRLLALFLDPPHYFTDEYGYLTWVTALWEGACEWSSGLHRTALLCWRLRWLRALVMVADGGGDADSGAEVQRMRNDGRSLLRRLAGSAPLPFAEWARLERAVGGTTGAVRAARHALRAALTDHDTPHHHILYIARVVCEVGDGDGRPGDVGLPALIAAVLRRPDLIDATPQPADVEQALRHCEEQCELLERGFESDNGRAEADELETLMPSVAEWGAVRALLAPPARRAAILSQLLANPYTGGSATAGRYWEQSACACTATTRSSATARALVQHSPHTYYLAVAGAGAPLWARAGLPADRAAPLPGGVAAFASLLPALFRAIDSNWAPLESEVFARGARRVLTERVGCGALGAALRLEAEGHAARPRLPHALYAALAAAPQHKWLYVRGAVWCGGEAGALADSLLEKLLRLHALPHELEPLEPQKPVPADRTQTETQRAQQP
ncbi:uncharacterized protein [Battus philenor]|uniref:uncharacterized protein n=1 Tax=Battus philenor TaxID=42288 RepID=UPI0035CF6502